MLFYVTCGLRRKIVKHKFVFTTTPLVSSSIGYTLPDWAQGNRKILNHFVQSQEMNDAGWGQVSAQGRDETFKIVPGEPWIQSFHLSQESLGGFVKPLITLMPRKIKARLYLILAWQLAIDPAIHKKSVKQTEMPLKHSSLTYLEVLIASEKTQYKLLPEQWSSAERNNRKTYDLASHSKVDIDNKVSSFISFTTISLISSKNKEQYESFTISSQRLLAQW